jgi:hypothetical protein
MFPPQYNLTDISKNNHLINFPLPACVKELDINMKPFNDFPDRALDETYEYRDKNKRGGPHKT